MSKDNSSSHFVSGVVVGAALATLITTATGRRLLKEITENGADLISGKLDLESIVDRVKRVEDEDVAENVVQPKKKRVFRGVKK